jgi:hypothetical protein
MITRPTTQQVLEDCAREVRETLMPALTDPKLRVTLEMLEQVLAQCALRAGHEMAWMAEEIAAIEPYVQQVVATVAAAPSAAADALTALRSGRTDSLHLEDRSHEYHLASEALSCALEASLAAGNQALTAAGVTLLERRRDRETDLRPSFFFPGRA